MSIPEKQVKQQYDAIHTSIVLTRKLNLLSHTHHVLPDNALSSLITAILYTLLEALYCVTLPGL